MLIQNLLAAYTGTNELKNVCIRINGSAIQEVAPGLIPHTNEHVVDGSSLVAIPGLINTHHHFFQSLTRCLPASQNSGLFEWLALHYPIWKHFDEKMFRASFRLAIAELILSGCSTSCDHMYLFPSEVQSDLIGLQVECAEELGLRFAALRGSMTMGRSMGGLPPDDIVEKDGDVLRHCETSVRAFHDSRQYSMRQVHLAPCTPFNVSEALMRDTASLARHLGVRMHTHLAETTDETAFCMSRYGKRPLALMQEWGWLGEDVWFAHGVHFNAQEVALLAATQTGVAHCPSSNCRLGSGKASIRSMLEAGVPVGLAVDGCASNDSSHMLGELRQTLLLNRTQEDRAFFTARRILDLATLGSARLLGRSDIGRLQPGMAADIALFDSNELGYAGSAADPIAALIFCAPARPHTVIVDGNIIVQARELLTGDESQIAADARLQAARLTKCASL